jgi:glucosamine kinase
LYDGQRITHNTPPLGYILGDEGSGAYLGKRFVGDCIKQQLPSDLLEGLLKEYNLTIPDILDKVYRQPQGNRFLASLTPYIYKHKHQPEVREFLIECFSEFFRRNILSYPEHNRIPVSFVGSIAWFFQHELKETARKFNLHTGIFIQSPIQELKGFHLPEKRKCV